MFNISSFLQKFQKIDQSGTELKKAVSVIVANSLGIQIDSQKITIDRGVISLKVSPVVKNEVFMNKQKIISRLQTYDASLKDIR